MSDTNVHAQVCIDGRDRKRLERVCRYVARPPLAQDRLELHGDGRVRYSFKSAWKDGTCAVLLDPLDLIARLCALIPPPRFHMLRYHGVLAGNATARAEVVPGREPVAQEQLPLFTPADGGPLEPPPPTRHPWAWLLRRVFAVDIARCPKCDGRMRLLDVVTDPGDIARVLAGRGQAARAPPRRPPTGQLELDLGAA